MPTPPARNREPVPDAPELENLRFALKQFSVGDPARPVTTDPLAAAIAVQLNDLITSPFAQAIFEAEFERGLATTSNASVTSYSDVMLAVKEQVRQAVSQYLEDALTDNLERFSQEWKLQIGIGFAGTASLPEGSSLGSNVNGEVTLATGFNLSYIFPKEFRELVQRNILSPLTVVEQLIQNPAILTGSDSKWELTRQFEIEALDGKLAVEYGVSFPSIRNELPDDKVEFKIEVGVAGDDTLASKPLYLRIGSLFKVESEVATKLGGKLAVEARTEMTAAEFIELASDRLSDTSPGAVRYDDLVSAIQDVMIPRAGLPLANSAGQRRGFVRAARAFQPGARSDRRPR